MVWGCAREEQWQLAQAFTLPPECGSAEQVRATLLWDLPTRAGATSWETFCQAATREEPWLQPTQRAAWGGAAHRGGLRHALRAVRDSYRKTNTSDKTKTEQITPNIRRSHD